ncbi:MAG: SRPBCC family protein [Myxococcales bacterium]|nr:SRPBCC family protein [Myxococcales bacterium]
MTPLPTLDEGRLRRALFANAAFSCLTGSTLLVAPQAVASHLAEAPEVALRALGAGLLLFAGGLLWQATRRELRLALALATVVADLSWVLGSLAIIALVPLSVVGVLLIGVVALIVAAVTVAQLSGLALAIRAPDPAHGTACHYRVSVDLACSADSLWPVIADLGRIVAYAPGLSSSRLEGGQGVGAVRHCRDRRGARWREEVTAWRNGGGFDLRFVTEDAGFPFPMDPMVGGWRLVALTAESTRVTVWWSFTTRPAWAAPIVVAMTDAGARRDMTRIIRAMGDAATHDEGADDRSLGGIGVA